MKGKLGAIAVMSAALGGLFHRDFEPENHPHENPLSITQEVKDRCVEKAQAKREARGMRVAARMAKGAARPF